MGRPRSFSLSTWRHRRDRKLNVQNCSFCNCPACGPRGRRVTTQTFDKHTSRMCADLLCPLEPESPQLAALYEEYIRRTQAGDVPAQDAGSESDVNASDGYNSGQDCQWHGVDVEEEAVESAAAAEAPEPLAGREPDDDFRSPHMRARACEQPWRARTDI